MRNENKFNIGDEIVYRENQPGKVVHVFDYQSYINPSADSKIILTTCLLY